MDVQTQLQRGKDYVDGEKKVVGAEAKVVFASEEDKCKGLDKNKESDDKQKRKSRTGPLVPDVASGKNVLLMTENVYIYIG